MKVVISSLLNIGDNSASDECYEVALAASNSGNRQSQSINIIKKRQLSTDTQTTAASDDFSTCCSSSSFDDSERSRQSPLHQQASEPRNIYDHYELSSQVIGEGLYGKVRKCIDLSSDQEYAVKSIAKKSQQGMNSYQQQRQAVLNEVDVMSSLRQHKGIVGLVDFFEDSESYHIVTELCEGGELYDMIVQKQLEQQQQDNDNAAPLFTETQTAQIIYQILSSVDHLHSQGIVHRDIKPENVLLDSNNGNLKLIDFGLAASSSESLQNNDVVGTPFYMAPEILKMKGYDGKSSDIWSIAVVTYILLHGYPPFDGCCDKEVMENVKRGHFSIDNSLKLSRDAKHFLKSLLKRDPRRRLTAKQALCHPWILKSTN